VSYEPVEQTVLRQVIRDAHTHLGWKDSTVLYNHLLETDAEFKGKAATKDWEKNFIKYIRGQSVAKVNLENFAPHVTDALIDRIKDLDLFCEKNYQRRSFEILLYVLKKRLEVAGFVWTGFRR
jgi:hypothetical protein